MNMNRIYRNTQAGEQAGGGEAAAGAGAEAPQYVSKADFDSFANEIRGGFARFNQPREEKREEGKPEDPREPDISAYDFKDPKNSIKLLNDHYAWRRHEEKKQEAKEKEETSRKESSKKNELEHDNRWAEHTKANPDSAKRFSEAFPALQQLPSDVVSIIKASRNSHLVLDYLSQNTGDIGELERVFNNHGPEAAKYAIGEFAGVQKARSESAKNVRDQSRIVPPRMTFSGGAGKNGGREPTLEERYKRST